MTPEEEAAARAAQEQSAQPTTELQPPEVPLTEEGGEEGSSETPKTFFNGQFKNEQEYDKGHAELLEHKNRVEQENAQLRDDLAREQSESQARATESTSAAEVQKTQGQNAEELLRKGDWLGAQKAQADESVQAALKPFADRQDALDKEARIRESAQAYESLSTDSKNFPKFAELEPEMTKTYKERAKMNPDFGKSFASSKHMMAALYFEVKSQHPEIFSTGRELAGAMSNGSAAGARARGVPPVSQENKPDWSKDKRWSKLGLPANPHQFEESEEDETNRQIAEQGETLEKLLAGQGVSE